MKKPVEMPDLIRGIAEALVEYDRLAFDEEGAHKLGKPASAKQIAKLEGILEKPLPPSYRAFLDLHNGWSDFDGAAKLLAVEDQGSKWVKDRLSDLAELFDDESDDPFANGAIPILLGEDENNFLVLDPRKVRKNGEMDFVMYDYGVEEERFKDFTSFLQDKLAVMRRLIDKEKKGVSDDEADDGED